MTTHSAAPSSASPRDEPLSARSLDAAFTVADDRRKGEGFALQITTSQNVDAIADPAKRAGATLDSEPADVWGARGFRLRDPDGFRLTVSSGREG